jgi:2,3-dihydroxy-2,3-dihydrophenylpropionate dehydrogenase/cis-2,3-dihydrobiphenyl-2,3-diol dehydrogenase
MGWLDDTVVLVTGAGSGLGKAIVERFIAEGARIGVLEINAEKAQQLQSQFGGAVSVTVGDATNLGDNERAVAATAGAFGKLDVLIGNAGLWDFGRSLESLPADVLGEAFDEIFHLNVLGYLLGARAALPRLRETKGSIILAGWGWAPLCRLEARRDGAGETARL